jgi:hypothetical protein
MQWLCCFIFALSAMAQTPGARVVAALDDWAQAAAVDEARYFGHFAATGVFMGTDATGRATGTLHFRRTAPPHGSMKCWIRRTWACAADWACRSSRSRPPESIE